MIKLGVSPVSGCSTTGLHGYMSIERRLASNLVFGYLYPKDDFTFQVCFRFKILWFVSITSNTPKNPGRKFYKCPNREESGGCGFFQWCDAVQSPGTSRSYGNSNDSKFPDHQCPCGAGLCRVLTAKTGENVGRQFYRCPVFEGSCGFFKWCNDDVVSAPTTYNYTKTSNLGDSDTRGYQIAKTGTPCYKCGKEGHWAKRLHCSVWYSAI